MLEIDCVGEKFRLLPEKAVFWPATQTLIVTDLHLGKSAAFRSAGIAVPETTTSADLERLRHLIQTTESHRLIILGDLFHSREGLQAVMMTRVREWRDRLPNIEIVLVPGNHDRRSAPPPPEWNFRVEADTWPCGPFVFSHEPIEAKQAYVIAGHLHPAFVLREEFGPTIRAACFHFGKRHAVLPAFGSFTGMSNVEPAPGDRVFLIGGTEVIPVFGKR